MFLIEIIDINCSNRTTSVYLQIYSKSGTSTYNQLIIVAEITDEVYTVYLLLKAKKHIKYATTKCLFL